MNCSADRNTINSRRDAHTEKWHSSYGRTPAPALPSLALAESAVAVENAAAVLTSMCVPETDAGFALKSGAGAPEVAVSNFGETFSIVPQAVLTHAKTLGRTRVRYCANVFEKRRAEELAKLAAG